MVFQNPRFRKLKTDLLSHLFFSKSLFCRGLVRGLARRGLEGRVLLLRSGPTGSRRQK
jgi:hypothetical protein